MKASGRHLPFPASINSFHRGPNYLVAMDLDAYWKDDTSVGRLDRKDMINVLRKLSVPDCIQVSALSETDPNTVLDNAASLARVGGATTL